MEMVLAGLGIGYEKIVHEPHAKPVPLNLPTDYQRHLYGCIESGGPALLGFELDAPSTSPGEASRHIIPVLGHTFNEDAWVPEAQRHYFAGGLSYYPSESWLSAFIAHDDNFGPYYCLPRNFLRKDNFRLILGLKPHRTHFSALEAETLAFGYAQALSQIFNNIGQEWFLHHLATLDDWKGNTLTGELHGLLERTLPDYFWMAELSAPELFTATRHKFGELLISADSPLSGDFSLLLTARLPAYALLRTDGNLTLQACTITGHTRLFSKT